jgi:hypothetical protein
MTSKSEEMGSAPSPLAASIKVTTLDNAKYFIQGPHGSTDFGQTRARFGPIESEVEFRALIAAAQPRNMARQEVWRAETSGAIFSAPDVRPQISLSAYAGRR